MFFKINRYDSQQVPDSRNIVFLRDGFPKLATQKPNLGKELEVSGVDIDFLKAPFEIASASSNLVLRHFLECSELWLASSRLWNRKATHLIVELPI